MKKGITFGAFDLFHAGHVLMLKEAKSVCEHLIVCVQTDPSVARATKNTPVQSIVERQIQISACKYVDEVIESNWAIDDKFLKKNKIDILIRGHDHSKQKFQTKTKILKRTNHRSK